MRKLKEIDIQQLKLDPKTTIAEYPKTRSIKAISDNFLDEKTINSDRVAFYDTIVQELKLANNEEKNSIGDSELGLIGYNKQIIILSKAELLSGYWWTDIKFNFPDIPDYYPRYYLE